MDDLRERPTSGSTLGSTMDTMNTLNIVKTYNTNTNTNTRINRTRAIIQRSLEAGGGTRMSHRNKLTHTQGARGHRRGASMDILSIASLSTILLVASQLVILSAAQLSATSSPTPAPSSKATTAAAAHSEPIKWSFGGWAPLNGQLPAGSKQNATSGGGSASGSGRQQSATSPLPFESRTTSGAGKPAAAANQTQMTHPREALSESASDHDAHMMSHHGRQHQHQGPAYAMMSASANHKPMQFSPPAPTPIVRDHLLPGAPQQYQQPPAAYDQMAPQMQHHHHQHQQHHQQQQQQQQHRPAPPMAATQLRPQHQAAHQMAMHHSQMVHGARAPTPQQQHAFYQQQMQERHRQHMMHHQQQVAMMHQQQQKVHQNNRQHHQHDRPPMMMMQPNYPPQQQQQQQQQHYQQQSRPQHQRPPYHLDQQQPARPQPSRQMPRYPGSPPQMPPHNEQQPAQQVGAFKVIQGEQPIMFTHSLSNERIPMIEVGGGGNNYHQNNSSPTQEGYPNSPTMAAIEKDNLNYHNALNQVTNSLNEEQQHQQQQQQSNNIQEIKQKQQQQYEQQHQQADKSSGSKPSYLTIPVAVETEGDKVLTSDDINEIEKHVINVLPNLKTANKIVKIADAHLSLASLKEATDAAISGKHQGQISGPEMHQQNYQEHRSTMKQLANEAPGQQQYQHQPSGVTNAMQHVSTETPLMSSSPYGSPAASSPSAQHNEPNAAAILQDIDPKQLEHQYYLAAGPVQEVGTLDPDQLSDYNLIKNDLLSTFRYEPTRATPSAASQQQHHSSQGYHSGTGGGHSTPSQQQQQHTASTPPMQSSYGPSNQQQAGSPIPYGARPGASVTRYFTQQPRQYGRGRGNTNHYGGSTTKTILGGRKVSEVMRNLIHTTPVPLTSPMHVPSVEPEKVDAIQLIAGQSANDKHPIIVEPHQLVSHTPDGGIDYNSGAQMQQSQQAQHPNQQNQSVIYESQQQPQQQQQQQQQDAIIEYVALADPGQPNGPAQHYEQQQPPPQQQQQQQHQQQHEQPENPRPTFAYDYTMATDQQQQGQTSSGAEGITPTYVTIAEPALVQAAMQEHEQQQQQQQQQQQAGQPSLAWSPSVASEHQQQQEELSGHAAPQMDMPATAGYDFFQSQLHGSSPAPPNTNQPGDYQQQEQEPSRWRSKAGGSQPNPDAQYDGQIVKGSAEQENTENNQQQQQQRHEEQQSNYNDQQQQQQQDNNAQQQPAYPEQLSATTQGDQPQQSTRDGFLSTNSYVGGAQMNHHGHRQHQETPSNGYQQQASGDEQQPQQQQQEVFEQQPQSGSAPTLGQIAYMKLDRDRQQSHLAQHQAAHQAQLAEIMQQTSQQPDQSNYQTTTPMSLTTLAVVMEQQQEAAQQQQQQQEAQDQQQQPEQQQQQQSEPSGGQSGDANGSGNNGYLEEQVQSRPSVQSQPESLIVNEAPIQMPIMDQQSLIQDANPGNNYEAMSDDDGAKQRQHSQPAGVYQVYQAYYAPKDHKPLPGYVRLSLEEFNDLFRDAEIQYVDRNLNGLGGNNAIAQQQQQHQQPHQSAQMMTGGFEHQSYGSDQMKASASEVQSILVDGRSIAPRSLNTTSTIGADSAADQRVRLGQAVKKIISIRNSRHLAKQAKTSKLVMKRVKPTTLTTIEPLATTTPLPTTLSSSTAPSLTGKSRKVTDTLKAVISQPSSKSSKVTKSKKTDAAAKKSIAA